MRVTVITTRLNPRVLVALLLLVHSSFGCNSCCIFSNAHKPSTVNGSAQNSQASQYFFFVNGRRTTLPIINTSGALLSPRKGDLALIGGYFHLLDSPGTYRFHLLKGIGSDSRTGHVLRESTHNGRILVGFSVFRTGYAGLNRSMYPVTKRSRISIMKLTGLHLYAWDFALLNGIPVSDYENMCITLHSDMVLRAPDFKVSLPEIPEAKCIIIDQWNPFSSYNSLKRMKNLRILIVRNHGAPADFNISFLRGLKVLKYLEISSMNILNGSQVNRLSGLRVLKITKSTGIKTLALNANSSKLRTLHLGDSDTEHIFGLNHLVHLRTLDISGTSVSAVNKSLDLPELTSLIVDRSFVRGLHAFRKSRQLRRISAKYCPISSFPLREFPVLRELWTVGSAIPESQLTLIRRKRPTLRLFYDWHQSLSLFVSNATKLKYEYAPEGSTQVKVLTAIGRNSVAKVVARVGVSVNNGFGCACGDRVKLTFFQGAVVLAVVRVYGFRHVSWSRLPKFGLLTKGGAAFLQKSAKANRFFW